MKTIVPASAAALIALVFTVFCIRYFSIPNGTAEIRTFRSAEYGSIMTGRDKITDPLDYYELLPGRVCININTADCETLQKLPGIGEVTAAAIVEFRTQNGPFEKPEDIMLVKGIGESKYRDIARLITTDEDNS